MALTESIARDTLKELDDIKKQISFSLKSLNNMFVAAVKNNPEANVKFKEDFAATMDSLKNMQANIGKMTETMENYSNSEVIDISFPNTFAKDYLQAKMQHQDSILMYKYGDYYVMVGDDAEKAAHILEMPTQKAALGGSKDDTVLVIPQSYAAFYGDRVKAKHESVVMVKDTPTAVLTPQQEIEMNIPKEYRPFFNVMKQSGKTREEVREIIANPEGFEHLLPGDIKHDVKDLETVIDETFKSGIPSAEKSTIENTSEPRPEWLDYFVDDKGIKAPKTVDDLMHDMYFGNINQPLPAANLRAYFHRYCEALDEHIEMTNSPYVSPDDKKTQRETLAQRREEFKTAISDYFNTQHKVIVAAVAAGLSPEDTVRYLERKPKDMPEALRNALPEDMRIPASKMMSSQQIVNRGPMAPGEAYDILQNNAKNFEDYNRALTKYFPVMEDVRSAVEREAGLTPPTGRIADQGKGYEILSYTQNNHVIKFGEFENVTPEEILELSKKYVSEGISHRQNPTDRVLGNYDIFSENLSSAKEFAEMVCETDKRAGQIKELNSLIEGKNCEGEALSLAGTSKVWNTLSAFKAYKTNTDTKPLSILEFYENIEDAKNNYGPVFLEDIPYEKREDALARAIETLKGLQPRIADNNDFVKSVTVDISYKGEKYKDVVLPLYEEGEEPDVQRYYLHDEEGPWTAAKVGDDMIDFQIYGEYDNPEILHVSAVLCKLDEDGNNYEQDRSLDQDFPDPEIQISNIRVQYVNGKEEVQEVNGGIILAGPVRDKYLVKDPGKERIAEAKENFEKAMDEHLEQDVESQLRDLVDVINSDRALPFNNNKEIVIDSKFFRAFKADEYAPVIADSIELYETLYDAADRENPVTIDSLTNEQAAMVYPLIIETLKARQERNANDNDIVKNIVVDIEYKYRGEKYNNVSLPLCDEDDEEITIDRGQLYEDGVYHSAATLGEDVIDFTISCPEGTEILDIFGESHSTEDAILISNIRVQYQSGKVEVQEVNGDIILRDNSQNEELTEEEDIDEEEEEEEEVSRGFHR